MLSCGIGAASTPSVTPVTRTPRRHLGWRAFAASLVLISLLTGFGYAALRANYEQNQREAIANVEKTARLAGALGGSLIQLVQQEIAVLGTSAPFADLDAAGIQRAIDLAVPRNMGFAGGMVWIDALGQVRASSVDTAEGAPAPIDFTSTNAVKEALAGRRAVETLREEGDQSYRPIVFAIPTYQGFAVSGVLAGAVTFPSSSDDVVRSLFGTDAILAIDSEGRQVLGSEEVDEQSIATAAATLRMVDAAAAEAEADADASPDDAAAGSTFLDTDNGVFADVDGSVVGYAKVPTPGWLIVVDRPRDELFAPLRWQFERSLVALGLLFLMSLLGAALASWRLDRVHRRETESRQLFQTVLEQLPVGVAAVDKAGRVVVTNERADLALGGRPTPGDAAPDTLRAAVDAVKRRAAVRDLDVKAGEWSPTGDSRTLVVRAAPVESGGQVTGAAAIVEDVTDQREREARAQQLATATAGLALASNRQEVAAVVADAVRAFGAQSAMVVLRDELKPNRLVLTSTSGFTDEATAGWESVDVDSATPVAEAVRTGREIFVTLEDAPARFPDMGSLFEDSGNEAWAALPLRSAGRIDGALGLSFRRADDVNVGARTQLVGFAAQVSQALDRAVRQSIEHDVALVLQRGLLQPAGGDVVGVEVASRYVPAEDHLEVGGDFFDVLPVDDGSVMLVIGDVVGHGLEAASAMGQLRSAVRALSATTTSPARVLELLDDFAALVPACRFATSAIVVVDADHRSLRYSVAGHPPPAWHDPSGGGGLFDQALSRPLGVYPAARPEATVAIDDAGLTVCLYTDGLIEKRSEIIDAGLELLVDTMRRHHAVPCEDLADVLLSEVGGSGRQRDDIAVLCARFDRASAAT